MKTKKLLLLLSILISCLILGLAIATLIRINMLVDEAIYYASNYIWLDIKAQRVITPISTAMIILSAISIAILSILFVKLNKTEITLTLEELKNKKNQRKQAKLEQRKQALKAELEELEKD